MSGWYVAQLDLPQEGGLPSGLLEGVAAVNLEALLETYSDDDLADDDLPTLREQYGDRRVREKVYLVAVRGAPAPGRMVSDLGFPLLPLDTLDGEREADPDDVLGYTWLGLPLLDNLHLVEGRMVSVRTALRWTGIEEALTRATETVAAARGRTTITLWGTVKAAPADAADVVTEPTGDVSLSLADPEVSFYVGHGYAFAQCERHSVLHLPIVAEGLPVAPPEGYELVVWSGVTPPEHVDDMARLKSDMVLDVPMADLDLHEEVWDAARVTAVDEAALRGGSGLVTAAARHARTGQLVAHTQLELPGHKPAVSYQGDTLVRRDHRGHGLGLWVKTAAAAYVREHHPALRRVHTWNATENGFMLAINIRLGFRLAAVEACWQKKLG